MKPLLGIWLALALAPSLSLGASDPIATLLAQEYAPPGVVFEIATKHEDALRWAVPQLRDAITRLRERFPHLPIAVVSHGREQFALLAEAAPGFEQIQTDIRSISEQEQISVHVCGVNAERRGKATEDFVRFVDVSPEGPAQIRDYQALGYVLIRLRRQE